MRISSTMLVTLELTTFQDDGIDGRRHRATSMITLPTSSAPGFLSGIDHNRRIHLLDDGRTRQTVAAGRVCRGRNRAIEPTVEVGAAESFYAASECSPSKRKFARSGRGNG
jgi:hypothetical protein